MSEDKVNLETPKFNWMGHLKNIIMALVLFMGGGAGSYVANSEMQQEQYKFQIEMKEHLKSIDKRLDELEKRP